MLAAAGITAALVSATALAQMHGGAGGPVLPPLPVSIQVPDGGLTMAMQDFGGRPVVPVMIDGKGPFPFILDTGASESPPREAV